MRLCMIMNTIMTDMGSNFSHRKKMHSWCIPRFGTIVIVYA